MVRVWFNIAVPLRRWVELGLWLSKRSESPRFRRLETLTPEAFVHLPRRSSPDDLDDEAVAWLRHASRVGAQQQH